MEWVGPCLFCPALDTWPGPTDPLSVGVHWAILDGSGKRIEDSESLLSGKYTVPGVRRQHRDRSPQGLDLVRYVEIGVT